MPTYKYKCENNPEHLYEEVRSMTADEPDLICTVEGCDGKMLRIFFAPPIEFKGGGWSTKDNWR